MKTEYDYLYEVWRNGGNPDAVDIDDIPRDFDWTRDKVLEKHMPENNSTTDDDFACNA